MSAVLLISNIPVLVPDRHLDVLQTHSWHLRDGYAFTNTKPRLSLHRLIASLEGWVLDGLMVDHINGMPTDNRLENLRVVNAAQNTWNRSMHKNNTSGFRGVSFDRERGTWNAYIGLNGKKRKLGRFETREEASAAYETAAKEAFGNYYRPPELMKPDLASVQTPAVTRTPRNKCFGVYWCKTKRRWLATARVGGRKVYLGRFKRQSAAVTARLAWENGLR